MGGWTYEPWRGTFYPKGTSQKKELAYASTRLTSIEINGTFYRTPDAEIFQKWHDETPDDFVFSVKAPRYATNRKLLAGAGEVVDRFFESGVRELKSKLGPINWQMAPTKKFDAEDFEGFLKVLPTEFQHVVEVRHESFRCSEFVDLARTYNVAIAVAGDSAHPLIPDITGPFVYLRIMGTKESEVLGYSEAELSAWTNRIKGYSTGRMPPELISLSPSAAVQKPRDVFVYFISGFKQVNPITAISLIERLS